MYNLINLLCCIVLSFRIKVDKFGNDFLNLDIKSEKAASASTSTKNLNQPSTTDNSSVEITEEAVTAPSTTKVTSNNSSPLPTVASTTGTALNKSNQVPTVLSTTTQTTSAPSLTSAQPKSEVIGTDRQNGSQNIAQRRRREALPTPPVKAEPEYLPVEVTKQNGSTVVSGNVSEGYMYVWRVCMVAMLDGWNNTNSLLWETKILYIFSCKSISLFLPSNMATACKPSTEGTINL